MALDLGKMYGPLPLGAWAAVVGGGLGLALYTRRQNEAAQSDASFDQAPEDTSGVPGVGEGPGWTAIVPPSTAPDTAVIVDNETWGRESVNWLIAQGYDPAVSDSAVRKYLGGERLGAQEYSLIRAALRHMGSPPVPLPPPIFGPPGIPKPNPSPGSQPKPHSKPKVRYYRVRPGDTLKGIAHKHHTFTWQSLYNANRRGTRRADGTPGMIRNPNARLVPGWKLVLP